MKEVKETGQAKIFNNLILERFTKNNPNVAWSIYIIFSIIMFAYGVYLNEWVFKTYYLILFVLGFFAWTLYEYVHHRFLNHLDDYFPSSKFAARLAYLIHGVHHEYPRDLERMVFPPLIGVLVYSTYTLILYFLIGNTALFIMPGYTIGYVLYSYIHVQVHKSPVPKWLKSLYKHHALHHYKYPDKAFGVSTTLWDRVFGTMPPANVDKN